ncbi:MAG: LamG domain-containing protein [Gammaproteobacteria bacterium]|nr:LamG domain-containing protein [Gammaproteobacteria bacterium]
MMTMMISRIKMLSLMVALIGFLAACGGEGTAVVPLPNTNTGTGNGGLPSYNGPAPASDDVQRFKLNLWDNLAADNRCGTCHVQDVQAPEFVHTDDINLAYAAANTVVNLSNPIESIMVEKMLSGHNCWLSSDQACADIIEGYIADWAGEALGGGAGIVQLFPPPIIDVGSSKNFPVSSDGFANTVYPLLTTYCVGCHSETATNRQSPYFASADVDVAYLAAQAKIDLDNPANSRLVVRLRNEFHNCWSNCTDNADEIETAITAFSDGIALTVLDPELIPSKALSLYEGILASSGGRHEGNIVAKWEFKAGSGNTAFDTSGVNPAMDLSISGDVDWVGGWGIRIIDGKAQASTSSSKKLHTLMAGSGEYTIEAWVIPGNVTQEGPARIISYSGGADSSNFMLGQTLYNYDFFNRSNNTDIIGSPALSTDDNAERLQAALQHVVLTYSPTTGRQIYINGEHTTDIDPVAGGVLSDWDDSFAFVLGNEVSGDRLWKGTFKMVALHNRVLNDDQIIDNFNAGVGEKFLLMFSVSDLLSLNDAYVVFEASQYDSYSYLFNEPFFISLDASSQVDGIDIEGIRLGLNGKEVIVGQTFQKVDKTINDTEYDTATGQNLSSLGTIIALEKGPVNDQFFLTFETIGSNTYTIIEPPVPPPADPVDEDPRPELGLKTFEKIQGTFASITGVSMTQSDVDTTYQNVKQGLPTVVDINTFVSAQQMAVTQLAIAYCNALVNDTSLRAAFFPDFDFSDSVNDAYVLGDRSYITTPLYEKTMNTGLVVQPSSVEVETELSNLIDRLISCNSNNSCSADRTEIVVKATCAAAIGNAGMLIH